MEVILTIVDRNTTKLSSLIVIILCLLLVRCTSPITKSEIHTIKEDFGYESLKPYLNTTRVGLMLSSGNENSTGILYGDSALFRKTFTDNFNSATITTYPFKAWKSENTYTFEKIDPMIDYLHQREFPVMTHLLFAPDQYFPKWFPSKKYTDNELLEMIESWISSISKSSDNNKKVYSWNVLNEVFAHHGTTYKDQFASGERSSEITWAQLGYEPDQSGLKGKEKLNDEHPIFIREIFETSRKYFSGKLELRDWDVEFMEQPKRNAFFQLVSHMKKADIPIDAVGFQGHLNNKASYNWDSFVRNVKSFKRLSLEVYVNEIDFGDGDKLFNEEESLTQKLINYNLVRAAMEAGVEWIQYWGMLDSKTWRKYQHALLFNDDFTPKPAYFGLLEALKTSNRLKVKAKGSKGGEMLTLKIDGEKVASWVLSPEWSDYSYPWLHKSATISFEYSEKDSEINIEKIWCYGEAYDIKGTKSIDVVVPEDVPLPIKKIRLRRQAEAYIVSWPEEDTDAGHFNIYRSPNETGFFQRLNKVPHPGPEFSMPMSDTPIGSIIAVTRVNEKGFESERFLVKVTEQ